MKLPYVTRPVLLTLFALGSCACVVALGVLQGGGGARVTASLAAQSTPSAPGANPSAIPLVLPLSSPANKGNARHPKLAYPLARLSDVTTQARARGESIPSLAPAGLPDDLKGLATAGLMQIDSNDRVQVYVKVDRADFDVIDALAAAGVTIQRVASDSLIVQGLVPVTNLDAVAGLEAVKQVRLPSYGFVQTGSVTTQGDAIVRANLARQVFGVTGAGVKVGVISNGVAGLEDAQASGDLPSVDIQTCNAILHGNPPGWFGYGDPRGAGAEGTAMLEIVHDIAPEAELWFGYYGDKTIYEGGTDLDFNEAVDCLAANTDVVVDDVSFYDSGPYDGTSLVSSNTSAQLATPTNPIRLYSTSVGNSAVKHYQGQFEDYGTPHPGWHEFQATSDTTEARGSQPSPFDSLWLAQGGGSQDASAVVTIYLQWDDQWGAPSNDYNLYLYKEGADGQPAGTPVASSENVQDGSGNPVESLTYYNGGAAGYFDIVVEKASGEPRTLEMFLNWGAALPLPGTSSYHNFNTAASSVPGEGDAGGGVISVGAIAASDPGNDTIETFSSRGPTNDGRTKPDIAGIDQVRVSGAGGFGKTFGGTSAAAPHVAGVAALLLECRPDLKAGGAGDNPSDDRATLRNLILDNAVDLGAPGMDNTFGAGRLDAYASALAAGGSCQPHDEDGDGVPDAVDNCPSVYNPDQANSDGKPRSAGPWIESSIASNPIEDKLGDACDPDDDNDGLPDSQESDTSCPHRLVMDSDGDTAPDGYEVAQGTDPCNPTKKPRCTSSADSDGDGILDCVEHRYSTCASTADPTVGWSSCANPVDSDGDGCPDWFEIMDLNGDRKQTIAEPYLLARYVGGYVTRDPVSDKIFDINRDGRFNVGDLYLIATSNYNYRRRYLGYQGPCSCGPE